MRNYYLNDVSFASSVFAVVTRNAIDFCHSRKGINTHVGCKFTRDRKKKKRQRARINDADRAKYISRVYCKKRIQILTVAVKEAIF